MTLGVSCSACVCHALLSSAWHMKNIRIRLHSSYTCLTSPQVKTSCFVLQGLIRSSCYSSVFCILLIPGRTTAIRRLLCQLLVCFPSFAANRLCICVRKQKLIWLQQFPFSCSLGWLWKEVNLNVCVLEFPTIATPQKLACPLSSGYLVPDPQCGWGSGTRHRLLFCRLTIYQCLVWMQCRLQYIVPADFLSRFPDHELTSLASFNFFCFFVHKEQSCIRFFRYWPPAIKSRTHRQNT